MKNYKYIGKFISYDGHTYELSCYCGGFLQAFFLLTADAIRQGKHYQLSTITDEDGKLRQIGDILKCGEIIN